MRKGEYGVEDNMSKIKKPPDTSVFSNVPQTLGTDNSVGAGRLSQGSEGIPQGRTQGEDPGETTGWAGEISSLL